MVTVPPAAHRERELKVQLDDGVDLASALARVPRVRLEAVDEVELEAVYHDTVDARLARWGVTLRRRTGGDDAGWHLKLPAAVPDAPGVVERLELHRALADGEVGSPPAELLDAVAALTREAPVVPLARVTTRRRRWLAHGPDGVAAAEIADDHVTAVRLSDGSEPLTFREVEVEALVDDRGEPLAVATEVVARLAAALDAVGARAIGLSKGARALGPVAEGPPDVVVPAAGTSAREVMHAVVAEQVQDLLHADGMVRRGDPDGVHDFRVAARTLRSALRTFAPLLEEEWRTLLSTELGWIAGAFGDARDLQVQRERLAAHAEELGPDDAAAVRHAVGPELERRERAALASALEALRGERYVDLTVRLVAAARDPRTTAAADADSEAVIAALVSAAGGRLAGKAKHLSLAVAAHRWHRVRILAKRARYASDALRETGNADAARLSKRLKRLTDQLGEAHDAAVSRDLLRELAGGMDGATGYALGLLDAVEARHERADQEAFLAYWPKVRRLLD